MCLANTHRERIVRPTSRSRSSQDEVSILAILHVTTLTMPARMLNSVSVALSSKANLQSKSSKPTSAHFSATALDFDSPEGWLDFNKFMTAASPINTVILAFTPRSSKEGIKESSCVTVDQVMIPLMKCVKAALYRFRRDTRGLLGRKIVFVVAKGAFLVLIQEMGLMHVKEMMRIIWSQVNSLNVIDMSNLKADYKPTPFLGFTEA